ncbi:MAG: DUF2116 family Zn-ribbon domain-containing protein [Thermoplasmata archaeon]|nr:MAG: DUF2116 family Zn-ribbon domain-containing protein [Thermoplasmata archaeon]
MITEASRSPEEGTSRERVPLHSHCIVCGRPIEFGKTFCSEACRESYERMIKARKRTIYISWGIILVMIVILLIINKL